MRRWAFNLFSLFSVLIFVASVVLWIRSLFVYEDFQYSWITGPQTSGLYQDVVYVFEMELGRGAIEIGTGTQRDQDRSQFNGGWSYDRYPPDTRRHPEGAYGNRINIQFAGLHLYQEVYYPRSNPPGDRTEETTDTGALLPLWLSLPFAIPPIVWLKRWRRSRGRGFPVSPSTAPAAEAAAPKPEESG